MEINMAFSVGLRIANRSEHVVVEAEDALVAALKVKLQKSDALITYVRRKNKRGDARHPGHTLSTAAR